MRRPCASRAVPVAVLAMALEGLASCHATVHGTTPRGVLAEVSVAARAGDAAALYALLPAAARRAEGVEAFRARTARDAQELGSLADRVVRALARRAPAVDVALAGGDAVATQDDPEGWRIARPGFGPPVGATPDDAVRALHLALREQSLGAVLQALSARARGTFASELAALEAGTADPAGLEHTVVGGRVRVRLQDGRYLWLEQEDGVWRVEDLRDEP